MFLSQLVLNPKSRQARRDLSDRHDLHRTIMRAYPETMPANERVLYRVEEETSEPIVLIQSRIEPDWEQVPRLQNNYLRMPPRVRAATPHLIPDLQTRFRLQANPTVKRDGKRHAIYPEPDLMAWLERKGQQHGFVVDQSFLHINKLGKRYGKKRKRQWHAVQFDGVLTIVDVARFGDTLHQGIGSAKAFGFGLLSIPHAT